MKVLTLKFGREIHEIHMLNPGEVFEDFGGNSDLFVGSTASIVIRRTNLTADIIEDREMEISDPRLLGLDHTDAPDPRDKRAGSGAGRSKGGRNQRPSRDKSMREIRSTDLATVVSRSSAVVPLRTIWHRQAG